jgi:chemotaxis response regulator CheB
MEKIQVLLVAIQPLMSEGLSKILQQQGTLELACLNAPDILQFEKYLRGSLPDVILIAAEEGHPQAAQLAACALNQGREVTVVWIGMESDSIRLIKSHRLPADHASLIEAICRECPGADTPVS